MIKVKQDYFVKNEGRWIKLKTSEIEDDGFVKEFMDFLPMRRELFGNTVTIKEQDIPDIGKTLTHATVIDKEKQRKWDYTITYTKEA